MCNDFWVFSLMSHTLKILLKILLNRIYAVCEQNIGNEQFGFCIGWSTRGALFFMMKILQNSRELRKKIYICFIVFENTFNRVEHTKHFQSLIVLRKRVTVRYEDATSTLSKSWTNVSTMVCESEMYHDVIAKFCYIVKLRNKFIFIIKQRMNLYWLQTVL